MQPSDAGASREAIDTAEDRDLFRRAMIDIGIVARAMVGAEGGSVTSTDGAMELTIPAGALGYDPTLLARGAAAVLRLLRG